MRITVDFGTHWPTKGHEMLLEPGPTGATGCPGLQAAYRWIPPL